MILRQPKASPRPFVHDKEQHTPKPQAHLPAQQQQEEELPSKADRRKTITARAGSIAPPPPPPVEDFGDSSSRAEDSSTQLQESIKHIDFRKLYSLIDERFVRTKQQEDKRN